MHNEIIDQNECDREKTWIETSIHMAYEFQINADKVNSTV